MDGVGSMVSLSVISRQRYMKVVGRFLVGKPSPKLGVNLKRSNKLLSLPGGLASAVYITALSVGEKESVER